MQIRSTVLLAVSIFAGTMLLQASSPPKAAATDFDCDDFPNQATAQEYLHPGDPYFLDADNDGVACESLPCPCAGKTQGSGQTAAKPPAPSRLDEAAARRMARKAAREFAQSHERVTTTAVGDCKRRAARHVDCLAIDRGKSDTTRTICHLRVAVRGDSATPRAKLASVNCRTTSLFTLTEARALAAIGEEMSKLVAEPVRIVGVHRDSRTSFTASIEWTRSNPTGGLEKCSALSEAKLSTPDNLTVSLLIFDCNPTRAQ
jgi:hypothetical protein